MTGGERVHGIQGDHRVWTASTRAGVRPDRGYLTWSRAGRHGVVAYAAGLVLIVLAWAVGTTVVAAVVVGHGGPAPAAPAPFLAYLTATFALGALAVPAVVRLVHRRPAWSVVSGQAADPVLRPFLTGAAVAVAASLVVELAALPVSPVRLAAWQPWDWLCLLAVAGIGFAVQAGFEELLFRGYLMQAVASRTGRAVIVVVVPALAFALPHWGNLASHRNDPRQLAPYLMMGLALGWAAWRSGSLWLPFGMHWANNVYVTVLVAPVGDVVGGGAVLERGLDGMTLEALIVLTTLTCALQVAALEWVLRRRGGVRSGSGPTAIPAVGADHHSVT